MEVLVKFSKWSPGFKRAYPHLACLDIYQVKIHVGYSFGSFFNISIYTLLGQKQKKTSGLYDWINIAVIVMFSNHFSNCNCWSV